MYDTIQYQKEQAENKLLSDAEDSIRELLLFCDYHKSRPALEAQDKALAWLEKYNEHTSGK